MEKFFDLKLTEQELEIVYNALLEMPAKTVLPVIAKIQGLYLEKKGETK